MEVPSSGAPKKVMVIADPTRESAIALQWALSHAVLEKDELFLLHVEQPVSWRATFSTFLRKPSSPVIMSTASNSSLEANIVGGDTDFLDVMKHASEVAQPKVKVHIERIEIDGKDKASTILMKSRMLSIDILAIGQRRSLSNAILGCRRSGGSTRGTRGIDTAEYLIEHSKCTCVGVQKKGQNGGYLLNSKKHRNFWLLA
ncbi:universal stress protein PHOS34 [Telopea speciosissima]|uniref:universal stress protein PHOS34 n=1 Tax=Telopea speciosissima TaxID=54955 RepID=UPI001CC47756|nr:universal stress protein PHOS34 [Telopea speciosissima]